MQWLAHPCPSKWVYIFKDWTCVNIFKEIHLKGKQMKLEYFCKTLLITKHTCMHINYEMWCNWMITILCISQYHTVNSVKICFLKYFVSYNTWLHKKYHINQTIYQFSLYNIIYIMLCKQSKCAYIFIMINMISLIRVVKSNGYNWYPYLKTIIQS